MSLDDYDAEPSESPEDGVACAAEPPHRREHTQVSRFAQQIQRFHIGPLPDPETLRAYDEIIPNGAERLMQLVERQSNHRQALESDRVAGDRARITAGSGWVVYSSRSLQVQGCTSA